MIEPWRLGVCEAAEGIRRNELTSERLVRACLERIAAMEPVVRAFVDVQPELALREARRLDLEGPHPSRPLHGVPVAIKEVFDVRGMRCAWGTPVHADRAATSDAAAVAKLREAGAVILGTTVSTEYAVAAAGPTTNPHDPARTPGGSSSGSAAAVAASMVPLALGSQTIGSIIRPSLYCGVLGLKPTKGAISTFGGMALASELDHVGPIARTPEDLALACAVLFGIDVRDPCSIHVDPPPLSTWKRPQRVMQMHGPLRDEVGPESRSALERAALAFESAGCDVATLELPDEFDRVRWCAETLLCCGMALHHGADRDRHESLVSPRVRYLVDRGRQIDEAEHAEANALARRYADFMSRHSDSATVFASAGTEGVAPPLADGTGPPMLQALWTLIGWPVLALPCGLHGHLPIGVQVAAIPGHEQLLLSSARIATDRALPLRRTTK